MDPAFVDPAFVDDIREEVERRFLPGLEGRGLHAAPGMNVSTATNPSAPAGLR